MLFPAELTHPEQHLHVMEVNIMQQKPFLVAIILLLVIIVGVLVYSNKNSDPTLGQKVGNTIDKATGERN